jgi:tetratricopeptide (TPR) repeat protein
MNARICLIALAGMMWLSLPAAAQSAKPEEQRLAELQARLDKLELRVAALEKQLPTTRPAAASPAASADGRGPEAQRQQLMAKARARMRQDSTRYSAEQIQEAESLYQTANKNWRSPEAKAALEKLVAKFPDLDRTGCAVLYLGQTSDGPEKEQLLKDAVEKHSDCFYGNGVQVGAFGRYLLGIYYKERGDADKATALFEEIRKDFPNSIDHRGRPLVAMLPKE